VYPSDLWNVVVKESDKKQLHISKPGEVITDITHHYEQVKGADCDTISITLRSLDNFRRSLLVRFEHDDKKVTFPSLQ
jgi:hypothetical protein